MTGLAWILFTTTFVLVLMAVLILYMKASRDCASLERLEREFWGYLNSDDKAAFSRELVDKNLQNKKYDDLKAEYAQKFATHDGNDPILSLLEADALNYRSRISLWVELMPQIGLLGTVLGVIMTLIISGTDMGGLWTALLTTALGLFGAMVTRTRFELKAEERTLAIIRVLAGERAKLAGTSEEEDDEA